jgi:hypothetical protein
MMSKLKIISFILILNSAFAGNTFEEPNKHAKSYLVVGISGFKTGRDNPSDISSRTVGKNSEPSGAWENLNTTNINIYKNAYLTHYSKDSEINSVLKLLEDSNGNCKKDVRLIMMINSWGAKVSQKLAHKYHKKCGTLPYLSILIEGISKPTSISYKKSLLSFNCVNYYQTLSKLHGAPIENCKNIELDYRSNGMDLFTAHILTEWSGSARGQVIIEKYLDGTLPVMFTRDQDGIDFMRGLP